jgi:ABC-type multidrug transport system ATPase subunit
MAAVLAEGLAKRFGDQLAVAGIDLAVERGDVFGLLRPNGAGIGCGSKHEPDPP